MEIRSLLLKSIQYSYPDVIDIEFLFQTVFVPIKVKIFQLVSGFQTSLKDDICPLFEGSINFISKVHLSNLRPFVSNI